MLLLALSRDFRRSDYFAGSSNRYITGSIVFSRSVLLLFGTKKWRGQSDYSNHGIQTYFRCYFYPITWSLRRTTLLANLACKRSRLMCHRVNLLAQQRILNLMGRSCLALGTAASFDYLTHSFLILLMMQIH